MSSTSIRRFDLGGKRDFYERHQVGEYWFVALDHGNVRVFTLTGGRYGAPTVVERGGHIEPAAFRSLVVSIADVLRGPTLWTGR